MKRAMLVGIVVAIVALALGLGWKSYERTRDLERRLDEAKRQVEKFGEQTRSYARQLDQALLSASAARNDAELAAARALDAAAARLKSEDEARAAQQAKKQAEEDARLSRQELAEIQQRREAELTRMHEALSRIAATRRTDTGLLVDLANDSFHFDFDKATLRQENREILSRIAGVLLASNGYRLFVHGHTDDVGSADYNLELSRRRAKSVADYLISAGIDPEVVDTRGFGKSSPRAVGQTSDARWKNRRVEIVVVDSVIRYSGEVSRERRSGS
jgi:outer membrane protein OmpA-like peptidoglycan-associated protein